MSTARNAPAHPRAAVPQWVVGLLVVNAYLAFWNALFLAASARAPYAALDAALLVLVLAGLGATLALAIQLLRGGQLAPAVGGQVTLGAMLTFVMIVQVAVPTHAAALRDAWSLLPSFVAAPFLVEVSLFGALVLLFLSRCAAAAQPSVAQRYAQAALGLAVLQAVLASVCGPVLLGVALTRLGTTGAASQAWHVVEWGGGIVLALLLTQLLVAAGVGRFVARLPRDG